MLLIIRSVLILFLLDVGTMMLQYVIIYFLNMLLLIEEFSDCLQFLQPVVMSQVFGGFKRVDESQQSSLQGHRQNWEQEYNLPRESTREIAPERPQHIAVEIEEEQSEDDEEVAEGSSDVGELVGS